MANDPIRTAAAAEGGLTTGTLLEATIKRGIYVLNVDEAWADLDQTVGEKRLAIADAAVGYLYLYDATDTTTVDDGLTCRVTGTGERYHIEDAASISISSVLGQQNSPPGSPANYDAYIVGTSPTGAWAAQATNLAVYTRRGWIFGEPETGMTVLNEATGANLQFVAGVWGDFGSALPDDSVLPVQLAFPAGVAIEAQQNAPPGVPGDPGILYLVGTAGSGAWSGHNNAFAFSRDGSTWEFIAAYEGAAVWNKATDTPLRYTGSAWVSAVSGIVDYQVFTTPGAATWTKPSNLPANAMVLVQMWAGGGGGSHGDTNHGAGGGGGAYRELWIRAADLTGTVSSNVAAGGAAGTTTGAAGANGGNSTFGSYLTAYGGGGATSGSSSNGGGGGGLSSAAALSTPGGPTGLIPAFLGGSAGSAFSAGVGANPAAAALGDGGAGGGGGTSSSAVGNGGAAYRGGGGGAGGFAGAVGGASVLGGAGGGLGVAGSPRGGGGGGHTAGSGTPAGAGGRGEIRVTVFA